MRKHTIPTPYMVGDVHVYSTEINGELVLFDTGPNTPEAKDYLQQNLDLMRLKHVLVTHCPGHSQSDLVFFNDSWAITGDVLLRGIFQAPLLDLDLESLSGRFRNYEAYCQTLCKLERLRGLEILPSHRDYIGSLEASILFYTSKLVERALRIQAFPAQWSVAEVVGTSPARAATPLSPTSKPPRSCLCGISSSNPICCSTH